MNKIYLIYSLKNQVKTAKTKKFSKAIILSFFEFNDGENLKITSILSDLKIKFNKEDFLSPSVWEFLINFCELSNAKLDYYFILPMNKEFLFKNVDVEKWVYIHSNIKEDQRVKFSLEYSKEYNEMVNYIDLSNKTKKYPKYISQILERI